MSCKKRYFLDQPPPQPHQDDQYVSLSAGAKRFFIIVIRICFLTRNIFM